MNEYMIDINLPTLTSEFVSLVPCQISVINKLMKTGKLSGYILSTDRTKLWMTINADSEADVIDTLKTFPIYPYIEFDIHKLAFNNTVISLLPKVSLN